MSPAPQRSREEVVLSADFHQRISALAVATNVPFDRTLETLLNIGLNEQNRRELELKIRFENFIATPVGSAKDTSMDLLGEAIFGK